MRENSGPQSAEKHVKEIRIVSAGLRGEATKARLGNLCQ